MFFLPMLTYALLGATISWASPAPTTRGEVLDRTPPMNDSVVPPTPDLGINCRGSFLCGRGSGSASSELVSFINNMADDAWYNNGQLIACTYYGICAFLQNTGGANGQWIKSIAPYIPAHRCITCGSVPYYFAQGDNDVSHGELTFNYVSDTCGKIGLC